MPTLLELHEEKVSVAKAAQAINDKAEAEKRKLSAEEQEQWDRHWDRVDVINDTIDRRHKLDSARSDPPSAGRKTDPADPASRDPDKAKHDPDGGERRDEPIVLQFPRRQTKEVRAEPGTPEFTRAQDPYRRAQAAYLRDGPASPETRGLQAGNQTKGGYTVGTQTAAGVLQALDDQVFMRQLGTVQPALGQAVSLGLVSLDTDPADATWTAEVPAADLTEDDNLALGKRELAPHLSTKLIKVSEKLLRASTISIEALIRDRVAYKFGITEEKAYLTGDGAQQPLGVFTASADGISTARDTTVASSSTFTADELIDLKFSLKSQYWDRVTWLMHQDALKIIRKLKDGNGQYLWTAGMAGTDADRILGRPYVLSQYAPNTFTTGLYALMLGDFSMYWIVDALDMAIQRLGELFTLRNQIGFKFQMETDGMPVLEEAFARLKLA